MKKFLISISAIFIALIPISSANAETAWRYWSYWQLNDGVWESAMTGPADVKAEDGQVQGWRYITAGIDITADLAPRTDETFESICAGVAAADGIARVAVVVDFGDVTDYSDSADAAAVGKTQTACVEVKAGDPSSVLLSSAFETREESGMVCAVNNLPATGCGEEVELTDSVDEEILTTTAVDDQVTEETQTDASSYLTLAAALLASVAIVLVIRNKNKN
jgi:hypothetical protein